MACNVFNPNLTSVNLLVYVLVFNINNSKAAVNISHINTSFQPFHVVCTQLLIGALTVKVSFRLLHCLFLTKIAFLVVQIIHINYRLVRYHFHCLVIFECECFNVKVQSPFTLNVERISLHTATGACLEWVSEFEAVINDCRSSSVS